MRLVVSTSLAFGLLAATAMYVPASADSMKNCAANWKAMSATEKAKTTYKDYSTTCLKSKAPAATAAPAPAAMSAPAPKAAKATSAMVQPAPKAAKTIPAAMAMPSGEAPAGATGQCKDGTFTMSKTHSGACSHHKGVAKWL